MSASEVRAHRALLLGPIFPPDAGGGLALALDDLSLALRQRGWIVDRPSIAVDHTSHEATGAWHPAAPLLTGFLRSSAVVRYQARLSTRVRRWTVNLSRPLHVIEDASALLAEAEARLRHGEYDVVLACPEQQPPGLLSLATTLHRLVVAVSLTALSDEIRYRYLWASVRALARTRTRGRCHGSLGRPVEARALSHAVFASETWRRAALCAGLSPDRATTIYFGVSVPPAGTPRAWMNRLLWVGRLSPEKGLHELLRAFPTVRARVPAIALTVIASQGPRAYARLIRARLSALNHESSISFRGACPRAALTGAYADHDALVFSSVFDEPVALVVLEAFAAGLPVIAARPRSRKGPLREDETCVCFDPADPSSLARAVERLQTDESLRHRLVDRARDVVSREFSIETMGFAYDALLRDLVQNRR